MVGDECASNSVESMAEKKTTSMRTVIGITITQNKKI